MLKCKNVVLQENKPPSLSEVFFCILLCFFQALPFIMPLAINCDKLPAPALEKHSLSGVKGENQN